MRVEVVDKRVATDLVIEHHYLHRRPPMSYAFGLLADSANSVIGVCTFGVPPSRHLQMGVCPSDPSLVIELNRLWVDDVAPHNTESWFVSRCLKMLPALLVVSYADLKMCHVGYVYRALNFHYAGWTDMDRKTPRYDYIPNDPSLHTRDAFRGGFSHRVRRVPKVRYWRATGDRAERRGLERRCGWPSLDWKTTPPPRVLVPKS